MMKIVVNKCYGGFALSREQARAMGIKDEDIYDGVYYTYDMDRTDPNLVAVIEAGIPDATYSELKVVEIPDNHFYRIEEYDGHEHVVHSASEIFYA